MQLTHDVYQAHEQSKEIVLLCDRIGSPANQGGLFRLADAFGVKELVFTGNPLDITSSRLKRTARNTQAHIPYFQHDTAVTAIKEYLKEGYKCIALEITASSKSLSKTAITGNKILLIIGNEQHGISQEILDIANLIVHIPMYGKNSSMNVTQAAAIALHHISL